MIVQSHKLAGLRTVWDGAGRSLGCKILELGWKHGHSSVRF